MIWYDYNISLRLDEIAVVIVYLYCIYEMMVVQYKYVYIHMYVKHLDVLNCNMIICNAMIQSMIHTICILESDDAASVKIRTELTNI